MTTNIRTLRNGKEVTVATEPIYENLGDIFEPPYNSTFIEHENNTNSDTIIIVIPENDLEEPPHTQFEMAFNLENFRDLIPAFAGEKEKLTHFIICVNNFNRSLPEVNRPTLLDSLIYKLSGDACDLYAEGGFNTWEQLSQRLKDRFQPQASFKDAQERLITLRQKPSERVKDFAARIKQARSELEAASQRKYVSADARAEVLDDVNDMALRAFRNGLNDPLRMIIRCMRNATLAETIAAAIDEEQDVLVARTPRFCEFCKREGHLERECRTKTYANRNNEVKRETFSPRRPTFKEPTCYTCHQTGHISPVCPNRSNVNQADRPPRQGPLDTPVPRRQVNHLDGEHDNQNGRFVWVSEESKNESTPPSGASA